MESAEPSMASINAVATRDSLVLRAHSLLAQTVALAEAIVPMGFACAIQHSRAPTAPDARARSPVLATGSVTA